VLTAFKITGARRCRRDQPQRVRVLNRVKIIPTRSRGEAATADPARHGTQPRRGLPMLNPKGIEETGVAAFGRKPDE